MRKSFRIAALNIVFGLAIFAQTNRAGADEGGQQKPALLERASKVTMKYLLY
jgi:hypothetical protein